MFEKFKMLKISDWNNPPEEALNACVLLYSDENSSPDILPSIGLYLEVPPVDGDPYHRVRMVVRLYGDKILLNCSSHNPFSPSRGKMTRTVIVPTAPYNGYESKAITTSNIHTSVPYLPTEGDILIG